MLSQSVATRKRFAKLIGFENGSFDLDEMLLECQFLSVLNYAPRRRQRKWLDFQTCDEDRLARKINGRIRVAARLGMLVAQKQVRTKAGPAVRLA